MKKILSLLMMSLLCVGAWADEVTFGPDFSASNWTAVEEGSVYTWTKDGVTITFNKAGQSQDPATWSFLSTWLRMGKNNPYLEVSVESGKIKAINVTMVNNYQLSNFVVDGDPFTLITNQGGVQTGKWTSEAGVSSVELTALNTINIGSLVFTIDITSGINGINADNVVSVRYYDLQGRMVDESAQGVLIRQTVAADGKVVTSKVIR